MSSHQDHWLLDRSKLCSVQEHTGTSIIFHIIFFEGLGVYWEDRASRTKQYNSVDCIMIGVGELEQITRRECVPKEPNSDDHTPNKSPLTKTLADG